ncbi:MAG: hypothetical protein QM398_13100 [Thermoproteota archaeon]|nr:hypothetical protein [Thermoproteota archaeon]
MVAMLFAFCLVTLGLTGFFGAVACWLHQDCLVFKNYGLGDCVLPENLGGGLPKKTRVYDVVEFGSAEDLRLFCGCDYGYMEDDLRAC